MAGINLAGSGQQLDGSLPTLYSEFKLLYDAMGIMKSTATKMQLKKHEGASKNVNNYGRVVAYDVGNGVDITQAQDLSDATTSYTPGDVAVQVILSRQTMEQIQDPDVEGRTARMLANAFDLKEDVDGCNQMVSFTNALGAAGTVLSPGHLLAAQARQKTGNNRSNPEPFPGPYYTVLHPYQAIVIAGRVMPLSNVPTGTNVYGANTGAHAGVTVANGSSTAMTKALLEEGLEAIGRFAGSTVKLDANIAIDTSDDGSGAYFSKEGLIYVSEHSPRLAPQKDDQSMRGAAELNLWGSYAWGLYRAGASGTELLFDASIPTS